MKMHFIINGFEEGASHFFDLGHFTWEEIKDMAENGKVIVRNGNRFRIELAW